MSGGAVAQMADRDLRLRARAGQQGLGDEAVIGLGAERIDEFDPASHACLAFYQRRCCSLLARSPGRSRRNSPRSKSGALAAHRLRQQLARQRSREIAEDMPGVQHQPVDAGNRPDDRQRIGRLRQQAGPDALDRQRLDRRHRVAEHGQGQRQAGHRRPVVEAGEIHRAAEQDAAVLALHGELEKLHPVEGRFQRMGGADVAVARQIADERILLQRRRPVEQRLEPEGRRLGLDHLQPHGRDRHVDAVRRQQLRRPGAGRQHDRVGGEAVLGRAHAAAAAPLHQQRLDLRARQHARAMPLGAGHQRIDQLAACSDGHRADSRSPRRRGSESAGQCSRACFASSSSIGRPAARRSATRLSNSGRCRSSKK